MHVEKKYLKYAIKVLNPYFTKQIYQAVSSKLNDIFYDSYKCMIE